MDIIRIFSKYSNDLLEDYAIKMEFSPLYKVLLSLEPALVNIKLKDYLASFNKNSLLEIIDMIDARGRILLA